MITKWISEKEEKEEVSSSYFFFLFLRSKNFFLSFLWKKLDNNNKLFLANKII